MNSQGYREILEAHESLFGSARALAELARQKDLRHHASDLDHLIEIARREQLERESREVALDTRLPHAP